MLRWQYPFEVREGNYRKKIVPTLLKRVARPWTVLVPPDEPTKIFRCRPNFRISQFSTILSNPLTQAAKERDGMVPTCPFDFEIMQRMQVHLAVLGGCGL